MSRPPREKPSRTPFWLRASVVIGGCSLLLGLIGAVAMIVRGEDRVPDMGPGYRPGLTLTGLPDDMLATLTVSVMWWEKEHDAQVRQDAEPVAASPGSFRLPPNARGRSVELDVLKGREIILRKKVQVREGATITIDLAKEPAYRGEDGR